MSKEKKQIRNNEKMTSGFALHLLTLTIADYQQVSQNVQQATALSGVKKSILAKALSMSPSTFYRKRKLKTFTVEQLLLLHEIIRRPLNVDSVSK
jgi:hypothetical protein